MRESEARNAAVISASLDALIVIDANTLITEGKVIPDGVLVVGSPGKIVRELKPEERERLLGIATGYVERSRLYARELKPIT